MRLARRNSQGDEASTEVLFCRICGEQAENMEYLQVMVEPCHLMLTEFLQMHHNIFHGSNGNYQHLGALAQEPVEVNEVQQQPQEKVKKKFPCVVCKQKFVEKNEMKDHVRRIHFAPVVKCEQCGARVKEDRQEEHRELHRWAGDR